MQGKLIKQGAEARVFHLPTFLTAPEGCIAKERFPKTYRHPDLDRQLTAKRVIQEARCLQKCKKSGMDTPTVYLVDIPASTIYMENVVGVTVKHRLLSSQAINYADIDQEALAKKIGTSLAKMHTQDVVHGDLTTSNLMIRDKNGSLVVIDYGLSYVSILPEDKAVDLYVLERAFSSTHPNTESLFECILEQYAKDYKKSRAILAKLDEGDCWYRERITAEGSSALQLDYEVESAAWWADCSVSNKEIDKEGTTSQICHHKYF